MSRATRPRTFKSYFAAFRSLVAYADFSAASGRNCDVDARRGDAEPVAGVVTGEYKFDQFTGINCDSCGIVGEALRLNRDNPVWFAINGGLAESGCASEEDNSEFHIKTTILFPN